MNVWQPILGCDAHKLPPIPPAPVGPFIPHYVVWLVGGIQIQSTISPTVKAGLGWAVVRGHDAGPMVIHIAPNPLLPLIILFGGSKGHFGSGTVKCAKKGGSDRIAVGCLWAVNLQLHCQDMPLPPLPTGVAITGFNRVRAGFSFRDFLAGLASMLVDMAIQWALGAVVGVAGNALSAAARGARGALLGLFRSGAGRGVMGRLGAAAGAFGRGFGRGFSPRAVFGLGRGAQGLRTGLRGMPAAFRANALGDVSSRTGTLASVANMMFIGSPVGYAPDSAWYNRTTSQGNDTNWRDPSSRVHNLISPDPPPPTRPQ